MASAAAIAAAGYFAGLRGSAPALESPIASTVVSGSRPEVAAVSPPVLSAPPAPVVDDPAVVAKLSLLDSILASKNDNDPRLDTELRHLSDPLRAALLEKYRTLPKEQLNERGTIAFLVGRDAKTVRDLAFLGAVALEPPCRNPLDCQSAGDSHFDEHTGFETTLIYPQRVALQMLERTARETSDPQLREAAWRQLLATARAAGAPIAALAEAAYGRRHGS